MSKNHSILITSIFHFHLAGAARALVAKGEAGIQIIPVNEFPKGAPVHEDGSSVYDPRKPLAYFAVRISTPEMLEKWRAIEADFDARCQTAFNVAMAAFDTAIEGGVA